jgi:nitrate/TMAO reductase-like tetraheme cytochrome c subunit
VTKGAAAVRHPVSIAGAVLATVSAVLFIALVLAIVAGLLVNPYAGLIVFILLPLLFMLGLVLIPIGLRLQRRRVIRDPSAEEWPVVDFRHASVRRTALIVVALTAVNIVIVLLAGYGTLRWMETPGFCGQVCHTPMQPQFTAWNDAAHSRVACVECHIGEGASGFLHAKLSGVRQLMHVATGSVPRPIPPGADMPPGAQAHTCIDCHRPSLNREDSVRVIREYGDDEKNEETATVLRLHFGAMSPSKRSIHWHADPANRVEYRATDEDNQTIPYVRVTNAQGQVKEFVAEDATEEAASGAQLRTMDCVDCHNTVGHPISPTAERAVDRAIGAGLVSRELPHVRREGVRLLTADYPSQDAASRAIEEGFRKFYESQSADRQAVARAAAVFQDVYRRNVFPSMKVTWGSYPDNKGHITSTGCFRCHDDSHKAKDGATISADCEYCHTQLDAKP